MWFSLHFHHKISIEHSIHTILLRTFGSRSRRRKTKMIKIKKNRHIKYINMKKKTANSYPFLPWPFTIKSGRWKEWIIGHPPLLHIHALLYRLTNRYVLSRNKWKGEKSIFSHTGNRTRAFRVRAGYPNH